VEVIPNSDFLSFQYQECAEDHRHYSSLIWQVPSIAVAISGGILAFSFADNIDKFIRPFILAIGLIFDFVLFVGLLRYRMFEIARRVDLEEIEKMIADAKITNMKVRRGGKEILENKEHYGIKSHMLIQTPAYNWLKIVHVILMFVIAFALGYSIYDLVL